MKKLSFTLLLYFIFLSSNAQNITTIDLAQAKFGEIPANTIFDEIEIIPLELHEDGLLNANSTFYFNDKYIIGLRTLRGAYLFDRKTGSFIREASSIGQGPDEYNGRFFTRSGFDEKNNILFTSDNNARGKSWKGINIETNKIDLNIKISLQNNHDEDFSATAPWLIKDNIYVSFCNNWTGKDKVRLIVFDKNGNLLKKYPNYLEYIDVNLYALPAYDGIFYYYNGMTYFKEVNYNDTVFRVDEKEMSPHIIFDLGDKQPSYYNRNNSDYNSGKYFINFVHETDLFILFSFSYYKETLNTPYGKTESNPSIHTGYYDKKSKQTYISSTSDLKKSGYVIPGIPVSFRPLYINKNKQMIAKIDAEELYKYKDNIDQKYKHLFQNIKDDDNPIVIIARMRMY